MIASRRTTVVVILVTLAIASSFLFIAPNHRVMAQASTPTTFSCDPDFYQVVNNISGAPFQGNFNRLYELDPQTGNYTLVQTNDIGAYNAISYNGEDNLIYGIQVNGRRLLRIGANGVAQDLGSVSGLPNLSIFVGAFDLNGNLYIRQAGDMYRIDVGRLTQSNGHTDHAAKSRRIAGDGAQYRRLGVYRYFGCCESQPVLASRCRKWRD